MGVACQSFIDPASKAAALEDLWEMKELICRHTGLASAEKKFGRDTDVLREHHIDNIFLILDTEFGDVNVMRSFFEMIGLDALIGHGDRHWSNYGTVVSFKKGNPSAKLAPLYDTASGYLTEIEDATRLEAMLAKDLRDESWYSPKRTGLCKITIPGDIKANHFDLLKRILGQDQMKRYIAHVAKPFRSFDPGLPRAIIRRFFPELEPNRQKVIETILITRHRIGCRILSI